MGLVFNGPKVLHIRHAAHGESRRDSPILQRFGVAVLRSRRAADQIEPGHLIPVTASRARRIVHLWPVCHRADSPDESVVIIGHVRRGSKDPNTIVC